MIDFIEAVKTEITDFCDLGPWITHDLDTNFYETVFGTPK